MLTSSIINPITFKSISGDNPNRHNTLHADRVQGNLRTVPYYQPFNKDLVVPLQFTSDSNVVPTMKAYSANALLEDVVGALVSSYEGLDNRYFFNFEVTLGALYHDKCIRFTLSQGADFMRSEPIDVRDLSDDIQSGRVMFIKYSNRDRNSADYSDYWVDWSAIDHMFFYVESINAEPEDSDTVEVLDGSQSKTIVSSRYFLGNPLKTDPIPDYLASKIGAASGLDVFEVNDVQYVKDGGVEQTLFSKKNLIQVSIPLIEKNTVGLNVDDLGPTQTGVPMADIKNVRNDNVTSAGLEVDAPEGYMLHAIFATHADTSAATLATMTVGSDIGASDLVDAMQGELIKAEYSAAQDKWKPYPKFYLKNPDEASKVYVSILGAGAVISLIVQFISVIPEA